MTAESEGRVAAKRFRSDHHLGHQPLGNLVALIDQLTSIDVAVIEASADEHGMAMLDPAQGTVFIAVAKTRHPMRQRSTLAHELAHVLFNDWNDQGGEKLSDRNYEEVRADAFARHLLIPEAGLKDLLVDRSGLDEAALSAVVQRFLVSPAMAALALRRAGLIDEATKEAWMRLTTTTLAARHGWMDQYRALQDESNRTLAPQRLVARATSGYLEQVVSAQTVARLRHVHVDQMKADLAEAGLVPRDQSPAWAKPEELPPVDVDISDLDDPEGDTSG